MPSPYCPACGVGRLTLSPRTYVHVYAGTLVHVPRVPAWKCDACGLVVFDETSLRRIELLVGEAGPPPNRHTERPAHLPDDVSAAHDDRPEDSPSKNPEGSL